MKSIRKLQEERHREKLRQKREERRQLDEHWRCPVCWTRYSGFLGGAGVCGDLSQGQPDPCPGVLVPQDELFEQKYQEFQKELRKANLTMKASTSVVKFYKDGDSMSVSTNAQSEQAFMAEAIPQLAGMIDSGEHMGDWEFQLERWLPQIIEVVCKLRGYKAEVYEERLIVAGTHIPAEVFSAFARTSLQEADINIPAPTLAPALK